VVDNSDLMLPTDDLSSYLEVPDRCDSSNLLPGTPAVWSIYRPLSIVICLTSKDSSRRLRQSRQTLPRAEEVTEIPGALNGSMQHWPGVYQLEFQSLKFFAGVDSVVRLLCRDRLENSRIS
jgi:hypothetical protein